MFSSLIKDLEATYDHLTALYIQAQSDAEATEDEVSESMHGDIDTYNELRGRHHRERATAKALHMKIERVGNAIQNMQAAERIQTP